MSDIEDGGPAFPYPELHDSVPMPNGEYRHLPASTGMSKRELFAAILMHSEAVTCGVPGEACEALVEASREAGTDVIDHMAMNAVHGADALLRALGSPRPQEYRQLYSSEQMQIDAALRLANVVNAIKERPEFAALPPEERKRIETAIDEVIDPEIPF